MRARGGWGAAVVSVVLAAVPAGPSRAEDLFGTAQFQFQRIEDLGYQTRPDGTRVPRRLRREVLLQTYDLNHRAYPRENVLVQSSFRFSDLNSRTGSDYSRTPQGSVRLLHPWVNLYASHQPTTQRTALVPVGSPARDASEGSTVVTRARETQLVGHFAPPRLPQLDVSWLGRTREAVASSPSEQSRQRSARLSYNRETWSTYGSLVDQRFERGGSGATPRNQRIAGAGASLRFAPVPRTGLSLQYDLSDTRSGFLGDRQASTRAHTANFEGQWRPREQWSANLTGNLRRVTSTQTITPTRNDGEATLLANWQPHAHGRISGGGGMRATHLATGDAFLRYLTLVAGGDVRLRQGLKVNGLASASHNWDPERGEYSVQSLGGSTNMDVTRRVRLDGNYQITANGDSASASQRYAISWSSRLHLSPLRTLQFLVAVGSFRVGPGLNRPSGVSRTRSLDVRWAPLPRVDLTGAIATNGLLPNDAPRQTTRSLTLRASPVSTIQFSGSWSRSSQERSSNEAVGLTGRELVSGRMQWTLTRRLAAAGGMTVAAPGTTSETKLYDATVTWSFGR